MLRKYTVRVPTDASFGELGDALLIHVPLGLPVRSLCVKLGSHRLGRFQRPETEAGGFRLRVDYEDLLPHPPESEYSVELLVEEERVFLPGRQLPKDLQWLLGTFVGQVRVELTSTSYTRF